MQVRPEEDPLAAATAANPDLAQALEDAARDLPTERPRTVQVVGQGVVGTLAAAGFLQAAAQAAAGYSPDAAPVRARAVETVGEGEFERRKALLKQGFQYRPHDGRTARFRRMRQAMQKAGKDWAKARTRLSSEKGPLTGTALEPGDQGDERQLLADLRVRWTELSSTLPDELGPRGVEILRNTFYEAAGYAD